jgi:hypothetical protein
MVVFHNTENRQYYSNRLELCHEITSYFIGTIPHIIAVCFTKLNQIPSSPICKFIHDITPGKLQIAS